MKVGVILIQAVLNGKFKGDMYSEDNLSSTIFGTLRYLPKEHALIPFLESAFLYDGSKTELWKILKEKDIILRCYETVKYVFWNKNMKYGEPDLILLFTDHIYGEEDFLLIVEAKFKSGKSGTGDRDQLMRYYMAVKDNIEEFSQYEVANFSGKRGYIIYLTEAEAASEIQASIEAIRSIDKEYDNGIFHLKWNMLHKVLKTRMNTYSNGEKIIAEDIIKYLERLGLREFTGISEPGESINKVVRYYTNVFFNKDIENIKNLYFNELPQVNINSQEYCFYRGNRNE
jgi:hypothetical protein